MIATTLLIRFIELSRGSLALREAKEYLGNTNSKTKSISVCEKICS